MLAVAHTRPPRGDAALGHFGLSRIITDGTPRLLAQSIPRAELQRGEKAPWTPSRQPFPGGGRLVSRLPLLSLGREVPSAGPLLLQRGPPGMANAPQPGRAARQSCSPAGWGLAGLFAFGTTPRRSSAPHKYLYSQ